MYVKQISVFIENQPGKLVDFVELLGREGIVLIALSIADTTNFGILRCIVHDSERAAEIMNNAGYTARVTEVLAVSIPDQPGDMARAIRILTDASISIEYLYSFMRNTKGSALLIFRVEELERAAKMLTDNGMKLLTLDMVQNL